MTVATDVKPVIDARAGVAALLMTIIGAAGFLIMPVILGSAVVAINLSDSQVGLVGSMLMAGAVASAISALFWVRTVDWRIAARFAFVIQGSGLLFAVFADSFVTLAASLLTASLGGGAVYSLALTVLSDRDDAERMFGISITGQVAFQVIGLLMLGYFAAPGGFDKLMIALAMLAASGVLISAWLPHSGRTGPAVTIAAVFSQGRATFALFGCLFFFFNVGCIWAYIERIGDAAGFAPEKLGLGLAVGVSVGMLGSLVASWQANRMGHATPLAVATIGTVLSVLFLRSDVDLSMFILTLGVYNFFWNYSLAYQYAVVADADDSGRCIAVAPAFHASGATVGPAIAAALITPGSFVMVNVLAIVGVIISLALFLPAARRQTAQQQ